MRNTKKLLQKLLKKTAPQSTQGPMPKSKRRLQRTLSQFQKFWMVLFLTLPIDLLVAPFVFLAFKELFSLIPPDIQLVTWTVATLLIPLPLAKNFIIEFILRSQGFQTEAKGMKIQFQSLFSALIGIGVVVDIIRRIAVLGIEYVIGIVAICIFLFPTWYRSIKKNQGDPLTLHEWKYQEDALSRSINQFQSLYTGLMLIGRAGIFISIGLASVYGYSRALQLSIAIGGALVLMSEAPKISDLLRICRKCGLWSHRAHQIDGYCPGCVRLALKSSRYTKRTPRFTKLRSTLEKLDRGLENLKFRRRD